MFFTFYTPIFVRTQLSVEKIHFGLMCALTELLKFNVSRYSIIFQLTCCQDFSGKKATYLQLNCSIIQAAEEKKSLCLQPGAAPANYT